MGCILKGLHTSEKQILSTKGAPLCNMAEKENSKVYPYTLTPSMFLRHLCQSETSLEIFYLSLGKASTQQGMPLKESIRFFLLGEQIISFKSKTLLRRESHMTMTELLFLEVVTFTFVPINLRHTL